MVTGVAPAGFAYPPDVDMWVTIAHGVPEYVDNRSVGWLEIIGRMKPGITPESARADLRGPARRSDEEISRVRVDAKTCRSCRCSASCSATRGRRCGRSWPASSFCSRWPAPTLVACCSSEVRHGPTTSPCDWRWARRGVTSSAKHSRNRPCWSRVGGLLGLALAAALVRAVRAAAPGDIPGIADVSIDWRVLAFAVIVTGASIALCVIAPMLQSLSRDVLSLLAAGWTIAGGGGRPRAARAGRHRRSPSPSCSWWRRRSSPERSSTCARSMSASMPIACWRSTSRNRRVDIRTHAPAWPSPIVFSRGLRRSPECSVPRRCSSGRSGASSAWTGR